MNQCYFANFKIAYYNQQEHDLTEDGWLALFYDEQKLLGRYFSNAQKTFFEYGEACFHLDLFVAFAGFLLLQEALQGDD